ncbi:hypothetical protein PWG71_12190 [Nocardiopsis sp. N85]|uniref:hypothetical protein n=1 Tax=Nocardiopsis sp. N85 TaxID=3029400 RepID=UPI00237FD114|nr:hypothetical protein [Nocardiopsis sp. N85]MDE3722150.1 hypothetical protein [Nocardiopsis sp. N85]
MADRLGDGFGSVPPFTLAGEHVEESRRALADVFPDGSHMDTASGILRDRGVEVVERRPGCEAPPAGAEARGGACRRSQTRVMVEVYPPPPG